MCLFLYAIHLKKTTTTTMDEIVFLGSDYSEGSTAPYESSEDDATTDGAGSGTEADRHAMEHTYDMALPVKHSYLGENLEELQGRTMLDDDSVQTLPLLPQPGVVLVPGQTLPLSVFYPPAVSMLRRSVATDRTFGVVCVRYSIQNAAKLAEVGTTAEIYEFQDEDAEAGFRVKAKGRQRFKILETRRQFDGNVSARVRVLPERILPHSLAEVRLASLDRFRTTPGQAGCRYMKQDAAVTRWPFWVHAQYECSRLVQRMRQQLEYLKLGKGNVSIPSDPVDLSYWVAQNLPLSDEQRMGLLKLDSAVQRLRLELSVLEKCRVLCCRDCQSKVAEQKDVFSMSVEGPQGTYVNPGGYIHETVTVHRAKGLRTVEEQPSTEYTWFPGYAWTIAECRGCRRHMGWRFTATKAHLKPARFWGLCRRSLYLQFKSDGTEETLPVMAWQDWTCRWNLRGQSCWCFRCLWEVTTAPSKLPPVKRTLN
ncbi:protein cereblon isoform X2 [Bacillus rossius redtenbacheri]|uniref:protein cereblon isoform X2 n=2 Tax=Bacillus rossius redtenbacheri TaxID=93214 RepID=UPI002FDCF1D9